MVGKEEYLVITGNWDADFEKLILILQHLPPMLLKGLYCQTIKTLYDRGIFGSMDSLGLHRVGNSASLTARNVEEQLRNNYNLGRLTERTPRTVKCEV